MIATPNTASRVTAEAARVIGEGFVADHLGDQIGAVMPWRVVSALHAAWVVPLALTSPGYGIVGIVGALIVDEELGYISAWTAPDEIEANATRLTAQHQSELNRAFERVPASAMNI